jgi:hypothetical protein
MLGQRQQFAHGGLHLRQQRVALAFAEQVHAQRRHLVAARRLARLRRIHRACG